MRTGFFSLYYLNKLLLKALIAIAILLFLPSGVGYAQSSSDLIFTVDTTNGGDPLQYVVRARGSSGLQYFYQVDCDNDGVIDSGPGLQQGSFACTYSTGGVKTVRVTGTYPALFFGTHHESNNSAIDAQGNSITFDVGANANKLVSIEQWGTQVWEIVNAGFYSCGNFTTINASDQPIFAASMTSGTDSMFRNASNFNGDISGWDVSNVTNMSHMFYDAISFNGDISQWDVNSVTDMSLMFRGASNFNGDMSQWDVSNVTNMSHMFWRASNFNGDISGWDVSGVTDMVYMFYDAISFNGDISGWDVSNVTDMRSMFYGASNFNGDISQWNVGSVTNMSYMFNDASNFNGDISQWDVNSVTDMSLMFRDASNFNGDISQWNVGSVTNMSSMFYGASNFNGDISQWNVGSVTNMSYMFRNADAFNQNLGAWNLSSLTNASSMLSSSGLSLENYDNTLIGWANNSLTASGVSLGAFNLEYCDGASARNTLTTTNGWTISGDTESCTSQPMEYTCNNGSWGGGTTSCATIDYDGNFPYGESAVVCADAATPPDNATCNTTEGDFIFTVDTTNSGDSSNTQYVIGTEGGGYNYTVDCNNDGVPEAIDQTGNYTCDYSSGGVKTIRISGDFPRIFFGQVNTSSPGDHDKLLTVEQWGSQIWNDMHSAFFSCSNFTAINAVDTPNLSAVTDMSSMFGYASSFNSDISGWDVSTITDMSGMFNGADAFNSDISGWDVSNVIDMGTMFSGADVFNSDISGWNVSAVADMSAMFNFAHAFNQPIGNWNTSNVTNMYRMFREANNFNQDISGWNVGNVSNMSEMFNEANSFNQNISGWDVSSATSMKKMFSDADVFNSDISGWDVSNVTDMNRMFSGADAFNSDISGWNVSNVTDMGSMFSGADMFNSDISGWNVSAVTDMSSMFNGADVFNSDISGWNVSNVTNMGSMFSRALTFNSDISGWDVSNVTNMASMFNNADMFNSDISGWDVSNVTNMTQMFLSANVFNSDISGWDVSNVTNMYQILRLAELFNQNLGGWNLSSIIDNTVPSDGIENMLNNTGLSIENYDNTLIGWANNSSTPSGITLGAVGLNYCAGETARDTTLIGSKGWTIVGDSKDCSTSTFSCATAHANGDFQIPIVECEALVEFYDQMDGDSWTNGKAGGSTMPWKELGTNPCQDWYGVSCDAQGDNVQSLTLNNNGLWGYFDNLGNFSNLIELADFDLSNNNVSGGFPYGIETMVELRSINVSDNNMVSSDLSFVPYLNNLQVFNIHSNSFNGTIPNISQLYALMTFDIGNADENNGSNALTGAIPDLSSLNNLTTFNIAYNDNFSGRFPVIVGGLSSLASVNIAGNNFQGAFPVEYSDGLDFQGGFEGNGSNYTCGSNDHAANNWADAPYDNQGGSLLCVNGVFCNDNSDCQSGNCALDASLGYNTCQATGNGNAYTEYECETGGSWTATGNTCAAIDYNGSNPYTSGSVVCNNVLPDNTTCSVCGDTQVDLGEQCDGSGQAQCGSGQECSASCTCSSTGSNTSYQCASTGVWTNMGVSCSVVDYDGNTTYATNDIVCASSNDVPVDTTCSGDTATPTCTYCKESGGCSAREVCTAANGPYFCTEDGSSCSTLFAQCGTSGVCMGVCYDTTAGIPTTCEDDIVCQDGYQYTVSLPLISSTIYPVNGSNWNGGQPLVGLHVPVRELEVNGSPIGLPGKPNDHHLGAYLGYQLPFNDKTYRTDVDYFVNHVKALFGSLSIDLQSVKVSDDGTNLEIVIESKDNISIEVIYDDHYNDPMDRSLKMAMVKSCVDTSSTVSCGAASNGSYYAPDAPDPAVACGDGTLDGQIVYESNNHRWTWSCIADQGGSSINCAASEEYCGDNVRNGTESCDGSELGSGVCTDGGYDGGTIGCAASTCNYDYAGCYYTGGCGSAQTSGNSYTVQEYTGLSDTDKCLTGSLLQSETNTSTTWNWVCLLDGGTGAPQSCSAPKTLPPAACGDAVDQNWYASDLDGSNATLCSDGSSPSDFDRKDNMFMWTCGSESCETLEKLDGVCGSPSDPATLQQIDGFTNSDLCSVGRNIVSSSPRAGMHDWICEGVHGGESSTVCGVNIQPACADLTGQSFDDQGDITDAVGCAYGSVASMADQGSGFSWVCESNGLQSGACSVDKVVAGLNCQDVQFDLTFADLGYPRSSPYVDEQYTVTWNTTLPDGVVYTGVTHDGTALEVSAGTNTTTVASPGVTTYTFDLENQYSGETRSCPYPITVQGYEHAKSVYAIRVDEVNNEFVATYRLEFAMPEGYDIATISDRVNTGIGEGFVNLNLDTLRILDAGTETMATSFEILDASIISHTSVVSGTTYVDGFDLAVQATQPGAYGLFIIEYEGSILQDTQSDVCNVCEIEANNDNGVTGFFDTVYAQSSYYNTSGGVCIDLPDPNDPSCGACSAGYVPCPGSDPDPAGGENQSPTNVTGITQCSSVPYCGCYDYEPPVIDEPSCDTSSLLPNTVACTPQNPSTMMQSFVFDPSVSDYTTCGGTQECGMVCEEGTTYDGGTGGCVGPTCDASTLPDASSLPSGANIVTCVENPSQIGETYTEAANQDDCDTVTDGCVYFIDCGFGQAWDENTGSCSPTTDIEKVGQEIQGSTGRFLINVSVGPSQPNPTITVNDQLTTNPNGDEITSVSIIESNGISGGSCNYFTTQTADGSVESGMTCDGFTVDDTLVGGTFTIEVFINQLVQGGDDEICNEVTVTVADANANETVTATDDDCIKGYNLSIEKNVVSNYDSGNGSALNTYPANIAAGTIYHGDWVVYEFTATNDGPQDAWSPRITDTLPAGLTIIDFLGVETTSITATIDAVNWMVGGSTLDILMNGKYEVGATTTASFSARYDDNAAGGPGQVCNEVSVWGENKATELSSADNTDDACLNTECGERQCVGEIYGTDFVRTGPTEGYGVVTIDGRCEIEGTCEMSDRIPTTTLRLEYKQCEGTYTVVESGGSYIMSISSDVNGQNMFVTETMGATQPELSEIESTVSNFVGNVFMEGNYDLADESTLAGVTSTAGGTFTFDCRVGSPVLSCARNTCDDDNSLSQAWVIGGPDWTDIGGIVPPAEGTQAPNGEGEVQGFTCNTCDEEPGGPGDPNDGFCPAGTFPIVDQNGAVSCDTCVACGCCDNGADLTAEVEMTSVNGQTGYQVVDVFCPDPPESQPPYPGRSYEFYPATDIDGDGEPDVCVQYDKAIVSVSGDTINYEITGFLGGSGSVSMTIIDQLDLNGMYNDDFVLTASQGAGSLNATVANNTATLVVTKSSTEGLAFTIAYSVTASWMGTSPVCNAVEFDAGGTTITDEECACAEGYEYCPTDDECIPEGTPCGYDKRIVAVDGDLISYEIVGFVAPGQTVLEIVDTLENATYNDNFILTHTAGVGELTTAYNGTSALLTVTKTSDISQAYTFVVTYTTTANWSSQASGSPMPVCNEVYFGNGDDTVPVATDEECGCPEGYEYCPVTDECIMEGDPCGYEKRVTGVTGNVVSYEISGYVPAGVSSVLVADIIEGGTYNSDFAFIAHTGTGTMSTDVNANTASITVTKTSALDEMMTYTITYSATVVWDTSTDSPMPVCNDIVISNGPTTVAEDDACACPEGYEYCPLSNACIPTGSPCGFDKTVVEINGNTIVYEIAGTIPKNESMIIISDTLTNATFNDDFVYTGLAGTGTFMHALDGNSVELRITRAGALDEVVRFLIRYSTTAGWTATMGDAMMVPVCNEVNVESLPGYTDPVDEVCACPEGYEYCPVNKMCLPEGEPCGYDKRVVAVSTGAISYEIDVLLEETQQALTITDILSGAVYNQGSFVYTDTPTNSSTMSTTFTGSSVVISIVRNGIIGEHITGLIEYTATPSWTYNGSVPNPICNELEYENDTTLINEDEECACPDAWEYCSVTDSCIPEGDSCGDQSLCEELVVTPKQSASAPFSPTYTCTGEGTTTLVEVVDNNDQTVYSSPLTTGIFTLNGTGTYVATCSYDGDTGLSCGNGPFSVGQLSVLANDVRATLQAQGNQLSQISWSDYRASLDDQTYLNASREKVRTKLVADTISYVIQQMIVTFPPESGANPDYNSLYMDVVTQAVNAAIDTRCLVETCVETITVGLGGKVCEELQAKDEKMLEVFRAKHTVDFVCISEAAASGLDAQIDCKNAGSGTGSSDIFTGVTSELSPGVFGFEASCDYTREGRQTVFTPTCSIAGVTNTACMEDVILRRSTGGSSGGRGSGGGSGGGSSGGGSGGGSSGGGSSGGNPCGPNDIMFPGFCVENEPKCAEIDPPSIQIGEYLPFRWDLELGNEVDKDAYSCSDILSGKSIPGKSLECTFEIYNGSSDEPIMTIPGVSCLEDRWVEDNVSVFNDFPLDDDDALGKSFVKITDALANGVYGEYQIVLSNVSYLACGPGGSSATREAYRGKSNNRICSMNFAVSDSYMVHKGSSLATNQNTDLGAFKHLDGTTVVPYSVLQQVSSSKQSSLNTESLVASIKEFVDQYIPLAVNDSNDLKAYTPQLVKKTVNDSVYVYDGGPARVPLTIAGGTLAQQQAKTVIVKNADLVVEGSLYGNVLWVVSEGKVLFKNIDCDMYDLVQGFFVTNEGFESAALIDGQLERVIRNDDLGAFEWCDDGRLIVDGSLIGPGIDDPAFIDSRRALLDQWFNLTYQTQAEKIFNGASILFKTNTGLWSYLPKGVGKFKNTMQSFK